MDLGLDRCLHRSPGSANVQTVDAAPSHALLPRRSLQLGSTPEQNHQRAGASRASALRLLISLSLKRLQTQSLLSPHFVSLLAGIECRFRGRPHACCTLVVPHFQHGQRTACLARCRGQMSRCTPPAESRPSSGGGRAHSCSAAAAQPWALCLLARRSSRPEQSAPAERLSRGVRFASEPH